MSRQPDPTFKAVLHRCAEALVPADLSLIEITNRIEKILEQMDEFQREVNLDHKEAQLRLIAINHLRDMMFACGGVAVDKGSMN